MRHTHTVFYSSTHLDSCAVDLQVVEYTLHLLWPAYIIHITYTSHTQYVLFRNFRVSAPEDYIMSCVCVCACVCVRACVHICNEYICNEYMCATKPGSDLRLQGCGWYQQCGTESLTHLSLLAAVSAPALLH